MLPTLYQYYTGNGIACGLRENEQYFYLNNKSITILAGAMHYFRVPNEYWRDRLRKIRAAGLNTVETYVPWNLHEPEPGTCDFGHGGSDFQEFLDIEKFLKTAQEEDLLAIVRIGPYICSELDFGGMPSWLLRYPECRYRLSNHVFLYFVEKYFRVLLSMLTLLQFSYGGPIIGFQIENEYSDITKNKTDRRYLEFLRDTLIENGVVEMIFMGDNPYVNPARIPGVLNVGHFGAYSKKMLRYLSDITFGRPLMVMEYWVGWYDHWMLPHRSAHLSTITTGLKEIFFNHASVSFYMFIGGTTFGFTNGATYRHQGKLFAYFPNTNSYDFGAPISEAGDVTEKYHILRRMIMKEFPPWTRVPQILPNKPRIAYTPIRVIQEIRLYDLLHNQTIYYFSKAPIAMEQLPIHQSYGYIVYRKTGIDIPAFSELKITENVCDRAVILINGELISSPTFLVQDVLSFGHHNGIDQSFTINAHHNNATLDILVENTGRVNYGIPEIYNYQLKGIWLGKIYLNNDLIKDFQVFPMEFKKSWIKNLTLWTKATFQKGPTLYKSILTVDEPRDTFLDMSSWSYGVIIVNGFVLSRYLKLGPIQTAFLPAPLLKTGNNEIIIFEFFEPYNFVRFSLEHLYARLGPSNSLIPFQSSRCMKSLPCQRVFSLFVVLLIYWFC